MFKIFTLVIFSQAAIISNLMNNVEASVATAPATGEGVSATGLDLQNQVSLNSLVIHKIALRSVWTYTFLVTIAL